MSEPINGELVTSQEAPDTEARTLQLSATSVVLIFEPHFLRIIAPPLGNDPEAEVAPNIALALTTADMLNDPEFVAIMFKMWEAKNDTRRQGETTH